MSTLQNDYKIANGLIFTRQQRWPHLNMHAFAIFSRVKLIFQPYKNCDLKHQSPFFAISFFCKVYHHCELPSWRGVKWILIRRFVSGFFDGWCMSVNWAELRWCLLHQTRQPWFAPSTSPSCPLSSSLSSFLSWIFWSINWLINQRARQSHSSRQQFWWEVMLHGKNWVGLMLWTSL